MVKIDALQKYVAKCQKLRHVSTEYGIAPHKPFWLLSVITQIGKGQKLDNIIYLTPDWVAGFIEIFRLLVTTSSRLEFTLPFYHLTDKGF